MIVSYASTNIREVCENFAKSSESFTNSDAKTLRAILSDIAVASHIGEVIGIEMNTDENNMKTGMNVRFQIRQGFDVLGTLQSTLENSGNQSVPIETIRRLRIDNVGGIE